MITDVESILSTLPYKAIRDHNRCRITTAIQNHISRTRSKQMENPVAKFCRYAVTTTKKFMDEHKDVVIVESDKGKRMVVMYSADYDQKMMLLLNNSTYKVLSKDPTNSIQRRNNAIVKRLSNLKLIDQATTNRLTCSTATCPRIYGQPKAHKDGIPLRPVVPNISAPTYQLSKFIATTMSNGFHSDYNITDSFTFVEYITSVTLPAGYVLVSFDVVSLFTNIPKELVQRDVIMNWNDIGRATNINLDLFLEMVNFCMDSSYFQFRDKYYQQTFGTAMGSPLSPILAEVVMETLLRTVTRKLNFPIPVLKKYVDDLILALPHDQIQHTLNVFNEYSQHLQFTVEQENQGRLPFLDTVVIRNPDQTLCTQWYSKPISSGRLLNYHSFHPTNMKINVAANFIKRVISLTTKRTTEQFHTIFQSLRRNNYPSSLINRLINRARTNISTTRNQNHRSQETPPQHPQQIQAENPANTPEPIAASDGSPTATTSPEVPPTATNQHHHSQYRSIPYIANLSPTIASLLRNDYPQVKVAYRTMKNTNSILRPVKDPICILDQCNVIYSLACTDCQKTYIGMTRNKLKTRISGHNSNINQYIKITNDNNTDKDEELHRLGEKTAMIKHIIEESHMFDLTQPKILDRAKNSSALPYLEMCHITHTPNTVNHRTDVQGLSTTYAGLLHTIKKSTTRRRNTNTRATVSTRYEDLAHNNDCEPLQ